MIFSATQLSNVKEMSRKPTHCEREKAFSRVNPDCMASLDDGRHFSFYIKKNDVVRFGVSSGPGIQCRILCVSVYSYIVCWVSDLYSYTSHVYMKCMQVSLLF